VTYNDHLAQLPDQFWVDQKLKYVVKGIVQTPLNTDRLEALSPSPGILFQGWTCSIARPLGDFQTMFRDEHHKESQQSSSVCQFSK